MSGTLKEISTKRSDVFWIDPRELKQKPGWNSRNLNDPENKAHVAYLKTSIRHAPGVLEPLSVFREDDNIYISDGHCRHAAVLELLTEGVEIKSVPVKTEGRGASSADAMLRQALDGKQKTVFELGHVFKQLLAFGWTEDDIAKKSGRGLQSVRMSLELQSAPAEVKKLVDSGRVAPTLAIQVLKSQGDTKATKTLSDAVDRAIQEGKEHATARHIGVKPQEPRKARLTQVAEMIEAWEWDESEEGVCTVSITDSLRAQLFKLLDI